jgi:hypothetical protein
VYDGAGRLVEKLVDRTLPAGTSVLTWNTQNIANGVYFMRLDADGQTDTHKLVLVK